jgi:hypothetical protein
LTGACLRPSIPHLCGHGELLGILLDPRQSGDACRSSCARSGAMRRCLASQQSSARLMLRPTLFAFFWFDLCQRPKLRRKVWDELGRSIAEVKAQPIGELLAGDRMGFLICAIGVHPNMVSQAFSGNLSNIAHLCRIPDISFPVCQQHCCSN